MPTKLLKGFVVGQGEPSVFVDGSRRSRPKLVEYEATGSTIAVRIGCEHLILDAEGASAVRDALSTMIEEMA